MIKESEVEYASRTQNDVDTIQLSLGQIILGIWIAICAFLFASFVFILEVIMAKQNLFSF